MVKLSRRGERERESRRERIRKEEKRRTSYIRTPKERETEKKG